jgi:hypothetical protein
MAPHTAVSGSVDDSIFERYRADGAVLLRDAVAPQWLDLLAEGVEYNRHHPSEWSHWYTDPDEAVGFWSDYVTWPRVEQYRRVVYESGLAAVAGSLMASSSVRFFHEHVLVKEPGAAEPTPWHHDDPYYGIDGVQNVSMWIALDEVPASSGLQFIAGSHRWGRRFVPRRFIDQTPYGIADEQFELLPPADELLAGQQVIGWDVQPGDVVAFHFRTLHGAPGNRLTTPRRAVSLRWLGDDARFGVRPWATSPPFEPAGLVEGSHLGDDPRFPLIIS